MSLDFSAADYAERRRRVVAALGNDGAMILPASPQVRAGDMELSYRPSPELIYLTGFSEPEALAVLCPAHEEAPFTLFVRPRNPELELWDGPRLGPEAAAERTGADAAYPIAELRERLPTIVKDASTLYARPAAQPTELDALLVRVLARGRHTRQRTGQGPVRLQDPGTILDELRLIKDAIEIQRMREATSLTAAGVRAAAAAIRPGAGEWQVEAAIESEFRRRGAAGPAFASIVASGPNATVLHYIENSRVMREGELLLVDAGAHLHGYNGDISRTFPVSGRFSAAQRDLYDIVLAARDAALAAVRPGVPHIDVHQAALRVLVQGMLDHRLVEGDVESVLEQEDRYKPFYPHKTSHWLGLEVHDVGDYVVAGEQRRLAPGMVLTIEPGFYIQADCAEAPAALRGTGIRLEDDVLVTEQGGEVLTSEMPILPDEVESLLAG
jgi:Xaa-Pro aminopeptidase